MRKFASIILLIAVLACGLPPGSKAQASASDQEIAYLVSQLSWNSVGGECRFYWHIFPAGEAAEKLLEVGKPATDELLKVLEDESRGVAAHLILSQRPAGSHYSGQGPLAGAGRASEAEPQSPVLPGELYPVGRLAEHEQPSRREQVGIQVR